MNKESLLSGFQAMMLVATIGCKEKEKEIQLVQMYEADQESVDHTKEDRKRIRASTQVLKDLQQRCKVRAQNELSLLVVEEGGEQKGPPLLAAGYKLESEKGTLYIFRNDTSIQRFFVLSETDKGTEVLSYTLDEGKVTLISANHYPNLDIDSAKENTLGPLQLSTSNHLQGDPASKDLIALSIAFNDLKGDCPSHSQVSDSVIQARSQSVFPYPASRGWEGRVVRRNASDLIEGMVRVAFACNIDPSEVESAYTAVVEKNNLDYTPAPWFKARYSTGRYSPSTSSVIVNGGAGEQEILFHEMTHSIRPMPSGAIHFSLVEEGSTALLTGIATLPTPRPFLTYSISSLLMAALGPEAYCARFNRPSLHYSLAEWNKENPTLQTLADDFSKRWNIRREDREQVRAVFAPTEALRGVNPADFIDLRERLEKLESVLKENGIEWNEFLESVAPNAPGFLDETKDGSWKSL